MRPSTRVLSGALRFTGGASASAVAFTGINVTPILTRPPQYTFTALPLPLQTPRRFLSGTPLLLNDAATPTAAAGGNETNNTNNNNNNNNNATSNESALDVAMRVNRIKKAHQSAGSSNNTNSGGGSRAQLEAEAWESLNGLSEDAINNADGKAVSLLLNSWAYFAKFWAKGKDGP